MSNEQILLPGAVKAVIHAADLRARARIAGLIGNEMLAASLRRRSTNATTPATRRG